MDSNFLCSIQRRRSRDFVIFCGGQYVSCFQFSFSLEVSFLFSFNGPEKDGRVLNIQVTVYMSSHDKRSLDGLFMLKELEKNLIHSVSKSPD